ncbi:butyrophilin-like protein 9 [Pelodiscus sinensis]|uniref:butyrophilin-like protein 9 n=1 Tax=Pelodiscus sinensis TaxID=13735 RepID=UPI003F6D480F
MATWWQLCVCSLGILLLVPCAVSGEVILEEFLHPVVGVVGQDVVLPCQLSPPAKLPNMDVQWRKIGRGFILVHDYMNEGIRNLPGVTYQNRTEMFLQEIRSGNVSLKLKRIRMSDDGKYRCLVRNLEWSLESTTDLQVAAVAPVFIDVLGPRGQGIGLACRSTGWFPKPELQWVGKNQQNPVIEAVTNMDQDMENVYSIESNIAVTEGEHIGDISCIVRNDLVKMERQSAIHLSSDIFPRASPWLAAFWVLFTLILLAAGPCAFREYTAKQKASQKKRSREKTEAEKETLRTECQELRETLNMEDAKLGFRRARSYMVPITLEQRCTHTRLLLSEDGRTVWHKPANPRLPTPFEPLVTVGREGFSDKETQACRGYWEVEVGDSQDWELGVLSETVRDKVIYQKLDSFPKECCWSLGRSAGRYHPSKADTVIQSWAVKPTVVGVFLDLELGSLSFYSVSSMALILEIPVEGSGRLFPFLSPGHSAGQGEGKPLSICPPSDWDFPQTLGFSESVLQRDSTALAQPPAPKNGDRTENLTEPPGAGETDPLCNPAPGNKQVEENRAGHL